MDKRKADGPPRSPGSTVRPGCAGIRLLAALGLLVSVAASGPARAASAASFFVGPARRQALAEVDRLREIQRRYLAQVLAQPGVHGMGIGASRQTGTFHFVVAIDPWAVEPVWPRTIEQVPVEFLRASRLRPIHGINDPVPPGQPSPLCQPCHNDLLTLPVEMGNTGHTGPVSVSGGTCNGSCTLGFKACDLDTQRMVYVTNAHCTQGSSNLCAGTAGAGAPTYHRSPGDAGGVLESVIGTVAKERPPIAGLQNTVDAASVDSDGSLTSASIRDIGVSSAFAGTALPLDSVQKSGRSTGLTVGFVAAVGFAASSTDPTPPPCGPVLCGGTIDFVDQIVILPFNAGDTWAIGGDSGSALLDFGTPPAVVGLNYGIMENFFFGLTAGVANPIAEVLPALDLSLNQLDCVDPCAATEAAQRSSKPRSLLGATRAFRDGVLTGTERGRRYIDTFYRFTKDIVILMLAHPDLLAHTTSLYESSLPIIDSLAAGRATSITAGQIEAVDALCSRYQQASSDVDLKRAVQLLRRDLHDPAALADLGLTLAR